ncbi:MAG: glycosyl hydrolase family 28-related protein [Armatimonadota bacterium]|jgi:hypothetical protein
MRHILVYSMILMAALGASAVSAGPATAEGGRSMKQYRDPRPMSEVLARGTEVVAQYGDKRLAEYGILDVTKAPYSADSSGARDSTAAIRQAVRDARDARMVAFFPAGTYRVSDTIVAAQRHVRRDDTAVPFVRDDFPCVLWGGTQGGRARIVLADESPAFADPDNPVPLLFVASYTQDTPADLQPNISFNNMIVSLDVDLGRGNPGAIGIDHQGAQGSVTEDVHVVAEGAFAGFRGTSGSGGSASHITVRGGRYGLYLAGLGEMRRFAGSQPSPVISQLALTGQTEKAIHCATRGPLTLVGASIEGAGIRLAGPQWAAHHAGLNMVDSVLRYRGEGAAITGNRPVCLSNVYFEDAAEIARLGGMDALGGSPDGWTHVELYAAGPSPKHPLWLDGRRQQEPVAELRQGTSPPDDLRRPHEWTEPLPSWEDTGVANVREAPYGAAGDGEADDTEALQRALDESRDVFLPKGIYSISRPLRLRSDSRLFGLGVYSIIDPIPEAPAFADASNPSPMLMTPDDADATCTAAFLQLWCRTAGAYAIHWQAGGRSMVRNVRTKPWPRPRESAPTDHPLILIDGNGGGRWYNALMHYKFPQGLSHRHVFVRGTRQPLAFYMLNPEHSAADYMVELDNARSVRVYAVKSETLGAGGPRELTPFLMRNSSDFRIFGHGGNAAPAAGEPMYRLEGCTDFLLANFTYQRLERAADAATWSMVEEVTPDGGTVRTPGTEFFTLYGRR